jgi:hypothetical protein
VRSDWSSELPVRIVPPTNESNESDRLANRFTIVRIPIITIIWVYDYLLASFLIRPDSFLLRSTTIATRFEERHYNLTIGILLNLESVAGFGHTFLHGL